MARIRSIKPEFFRHDVLQDLEAENPGQHVMLVFAGLWGHCDKEGCFRWKPRHLKLDILPFLDFSLDASLLLLWEAGLLERYEIDDEEFGFIPTFKEHQRISGKEAQEPSKFPQPKAFLSREASGKQWGSNGEAPSIPGREGKGIGREEEGNGDDTAADAAEPNPIPSQVAGEYAWQGTVIRLKQADYDKWNRAYHLLDLDAHLASLDDWLQSPEVTPEQRKRWFFVVSGALKNRHQDAAAKERASPKRDPYRFVEGAL